MKDGKVHWSLLLGVAAITVVMFVAAVMLKKAVFVVILPLVAIFAVVYILYTLLLALGYGDKVEEKKEEKEKSNDE